MKKNLLPFSFGLREMRMVMRTMALLLINLTLQVDDAAAEDVFGADSPLRRVKNTPGSAAL